MNLPKAALSSRIFLALASLGSAAALMACVVPASNFIISKSVSTTDNFYIVGGLMLLLAISSLFEALLIIRLIWGRADAVGSAVDREEGALEFSAVRSLKATGMKKAFVFGLVLAANIFAFDTVGKGIIVTQTRRYHVLTQLRSEDGAERSNAVGNAIQLVGDEEVAAALGRLMDRPGEAREWVAYAAGIRHDHQLADSIAGLLREGNPRERAAAAMALARLKDPRLLRLAIDACPHMDELAGDLVLSMGVLGKIREVTSDADIEEAGGFLVGIIEDGSRDKELRRIAVWALGELESPAGLPFLEGLLVPETDGTTLCMALEALGNIGAADSSPKMLDLFKVSDAKVECPDLVTTDFTGKEFLVCERLPLRERILREIANIGDREARIPLERIAEDEGYSETVRKMAAEIAFQMRYTPVPR